MFTESWRLVQANEHRIIEYPPGEARLNEHQVSQAGVPTVTEAPHHLCGSKVSLHLNTDKTVEILNFSLYRGIKVEVKQGW